jgi:hypothetical protein
MCILCNSQNLKIYFKENNKLSHILGMLRESREILLDNSKSMTKSPNYVFLTHSLLHLGFVDEALSAIESCLPHVVASQYKNQPIRLGNEFHHSNALGSLAIIHLSKGYIEDAMHTASKAIHNAQQVKVKSKLKLINFGGHLFSIIVLLECLGATPVLWRNPHTPHIDAKSASAKKIFSDVKLCLTIIKR